jgi:hypothetical protein
MSSAARYLATKLPRSSVPAPTPVAQALREHSALSRLGERLEGSRRRMQLIAPALPGDLARSLQPGPLDDQGWTLLAANAAVAAKLRQLLPRLEAVLAQQGLPSHIRVKLLQK